MWNNITFVEYDLFLKKGSSFCIMNNFMPYMVEEDNQRTAKRRRGRAS